MNRRRSRAPRTRGIAVVGACSLAGLVLGGCVSSGMDTTDPFAPHDGVEGEGVLGSWVSSGGLRREYVLSVPRYLDPARAYPLLILMHGAGHSGRGLHDLLHADEETGAAGFVTVYPEGLAASWNVGCGTCTPAGREDVDDLGFIRTLIDHLAAELPIDTARVFMGGHSLGAQFAHFYACSSERPVAGIATVSGLWLRRTALDCHPARPLPVLMIHGDEDRILPWDGPEHNISAYSMPEALERWYHLLECTSDPIVVEHPDAAGDGTSVQSTEVTGCAGGSAIELHRIRGGGHGWPGPDIEPIPRLGPHSRNLDAVAEILRFFAPYAR